MFNGLAFNGGTFNNTGARNRTITLASSVSCGASATADPIRMPGLRGTGSVNVASIGLAVGHGVQLAGDGSVTVTSGVGLYRRIPILAEGAVSVTALLGTSNAQSLAANATAEASGELYSLGLIHDGTGLVTVTTTAEALRIVRLDGSGQVSVTVANAPITYGRSLSATGHVVVSATAEPDRVVGGIVQADLSANASVVVSATALADPTRFMYALGQVESDGLLAIGIKMPQLAGTGEVFVRADLDGIATVFPYADARVDVTATATLRRIVGLQAEATITVDGPTKGVNTSADRKLYADALVEAKAVAVPIRYRGLLGIGDVVVDSTGKGLIVIHYQWLESSVTVRVLPFADVDGDGLPDPGLPIVVATIKSLAASASVEVTSTRAWLVSNLYDLEPEFRSWMVASEEWTTRVEPEPWRCVVINDSEEALDFIEP